MPCSRMEWLTLLKCECYPNQCTQSLKSLSKFQWHCLKRTYNPKMYRGPQKILNSLCNTAKEKQSWRYYSSWLYTQRYSIQTILYRHKTDTTNREPKNKAAVKMEALVDTLCLITKPKEGQQQITSWEKDNNISQPSRFVSFPHNSS